MSHSPASVVLKRGWTDLLLCGIDTDSCVYDTAVAAYHGGLRPWIVTDACASTGGAEVHEAALMGIFESPHPVLRMAPELLALIPQACKC
ncbi:hypothetical protein GCM10020000_82690 [Streptomyces olivoverticillatus]